MRYLDYHDLETALISRADAIGVTVDGLAQALRDHTDSGVARPSEDPWWRMPREVLERFGTSVDDIRLRDEELADASNWSFDGEGVPVPPDAIANVEVVAAA